MHEFHRLYYHSANIHSSPCPWVGYAFLYHLCWAWPCDLCQFLAHKQKLLIALWGFPGKWQASVLLLSRFNSFLFFLLLWLDNFKWSIFEPLILSFCLVECAAKTLYWVFYFSHCILQLQNVLYSFLFVLLYYFLCFYFLLNFSFCSCIVFPDFIKLFICVLL